MQLNISMTSKRNDSVLVAVLNPLFKLKCLTIELAYNTTSMQKAVQEILVIATTSMSNSAVSAAQDQLKDIESSSDDSFVYEGDEVAGCSGVDRSHDEMEALRYTGDSRSSLASLDDYLAVKQVFLKYNTPLKSSVTTERLFSFAGHIFLRKRRKLSDTMFKNLIF